jgi:hypothetical protein
MLRLVARRARLGASAPTGYGSLVAVKRLSSFSPRTPITATERWCWLELSSGYHDVDEGVGDEIDAAEPEVAVAWGRERADRVWIRLADDDVRLCGW